MTDFDTAITNARRLLGPAEDRQDTQEFREYERALTELIADTYPIDGIEDGEHKKEYVSALIARRPERPRDDFFQLDAPDASDQMILLRPTGWDEPSARWELYIPPTLPEHYEGYEGQEGFDPRDAMILGPWGSTYWATLQAAIAFLYTVQRQGNIKFNDGRTAE